MVVKIDPVCQLLLLEKRNYTHSNVCAVQLCRSMHIHAFYTQLQKFGKKNKGSNRKLHCIHALDIALV